MAPEAAAYALKGGAGSRKGVRSAVIKDSAPLGFPLLLREEQLTPTVVCEEQKSRHRDGYEPLERVAEVGPVGSNHEDEDRQQQSNS